MILSTNALASPALVGQAVAFAKTLPALDRDPTVYFDHLVMHWQVGTFEQLSEEYNLETYLDPVAGKWLFKITHDPQSNAVQLDDSAPSGSYAAHTYMRKSHGLGCAVAAMAGAKPDNFGPYAVQAHEIEAFFAMCGAACVVYNLDPIDSTQVYTHAEAAITDNYFPGDGDPDARWDFARTKPSSAPLTVEEATATAQAMRARVQLYKVAIKAAMP